MISVDNYLSGSYEEQKITIPDFINDVMKSEIERRKREQERSKEKIEKSPIMNDDLNNLKKMNYTFKEIDWNKTIDFKKNIKIAFVDIEAIKNGIPIVSGLHTNLSNDPEFSSLALENQVELIDVRKSPPLEELHFWEGESLKIKTPRIALLGMDCVIGKRTTGNLLKKVCQSDGIRTELIYTVRTLVLQTYCTTIADSRLLY